MVIYILDKGIPNIFLFPKDSVKLVEYTIITVSQVYDEPPKKSENIPELVIITMSIGFEDKISTSLKSITLCCA